MKTEKASDMDINRGMESDPLTSLSKGAIYLITVKSLTRPFPTKRGKTPHIDNTRW